MSMVNSMDSDAEPESKLISLISQLIFLDDSYSGYSLQVTPLITEIISLVNSMDLDSDSQSQPQSELISLTTQTISLFNSMDLDSQPKPLRKLISFISQIFSFANLISSAFEPDHDQDQDHVKKLMPLFDQSLKLEPEPELMSLIDQTLKLEPEPELMSLIHQIFSLVISMNSKSGKLISLCPQVKVRFENGKFHEIEEVSWSSNNKWHCLPSSWYMFSLTQEDAIHFRCGGCNGENHKEYDKAPLEIKHPLHPKHSLRLVLLQHYSSTRKCYCCDADLNELFYYCSVCDLGINLACVEKPPVLAIDHPKWHAHTLTLFPRHTSSTCDICGLADSSCPLYICSPCAFVVHQTCLSLPRVLQISRHPHRISFTPSFDKGDWSCGVCRRNIDNDYGGYSCIKDGCSYGVHSKCATQRHVWDGYELEGVPEEVEDEQVEPFEMISGETIMHFSHLHHRLRHYEKTSREDIMCQACIMPIYFGNFYSCMQCEYILHKECADLLPEISQPLHPHLLTLVGGHGGVMSDENKCAACPWLCTVGFFYKCSRELCRFKLHVQCATISDSLVHGSHEHSLHLSSKPGKQRTCHVCEESEHCSTNETFNCIECDFSLCIKCATLPQKVRYSDDNHMFTLSYGEKTNTRTHWCEECERKIDQSMGFYMCDEDCCVALHIECMLGVDLYMKPGSSFFYYGSIVEVLNNRQTSRPICSNCEKRCPYKIYFQCSGFIFCSTLCIRDSVDRGNRLA